MGRTSQSLKNSKVALLYYFVNIIVGFISRKIFLDCLGEDVLGLNSTLGNLLEFLNLAELGIGTAVGVTLYKPLFENDTKSINEIVALQGWLYRRIAYVVIIGATILMCFFPIIFEKIKLPLWYAYASFGVLLFSALLTYFVNFKQIILFADQKEYKVTINYRSVIILKKLSQILFLSILPDPYVMWLILEFVFAIIASISLNKVIFKEYPFLHAKLNGKEMYRKYTEVVMKIKQIFIHKLGTVVLTQTSPIIIYAYANLALVALYGNYIMITSSLTSLCSALFSSMDAGVGNLIAQGDKNRIQIVFEELFSIRFYISAVVSFGVLFLSPAFISLWLGQEYLLDNTTLVLMVAIMFISLSRTIIDSFKQGYGLFADVWAPGVEASLNLGLSVLLGYFWGLHGILVGVLISLIAIVLIWKPYYVFSKGFNRSVLSYFVLYGRHLTLLAIASVPSYYLIALINLNESDSWMYFVMVSMVEVGIFAVLLGVLMYLGMSGMRNFIHRLISLT